MKTVKIGSGFTLVELLIVVAILGMLAAVGLGQYRTSQLKGRDAQRKADLGNLSRALEMYYNDFEAYPESDDDALIVVDGGPLPWGSEFSTDEAIYMKVLPVDPQSPSQDYCYESSDGSYFFVFAALENENDSDCVETYTCNSGDYCFYVNSSNAVPTPVIEE
ncbi:MAG: prepilin-type N-terminal cleavage/methylation domain-containing protein [Patescibacteria group bacterium]